MGVSLGAASGAVVRRSEGGDVTAGTMRYSCADGRHIPDGHDTDQCPPCLRAQRDGIRKEYEANVNVNIVARLREMDRHICSQRVELARLNAKVAGPPSTTDPWDAFAAWVDPSLERWDRRASLIFRAGWSAARAALPRDGAAKGGQMKCSQAGCEIDPFYRYTWPGKDEAFICTHHVNALKNIAKAIGLHLQLREALPQASQVRSGKQ